MSDLNHPDFFGAPPPDSGSESTPVTETTPRETSGDMPPIAEEFSTDVEAFGVEFPSPPGENPAVPGAEAPEAPAQEAPSQQNWWTPFSWESQSAQPQNPQSHGPKAAPQEAVPEAPPGETAPQMPASPPWQPAQGRPKVPGDTAGPPPAYCYPPPAPQVQDMQPPYPPYAQQAPQPRQPVWQNTAYAPGQPPYSGPNDPNHAQNIYHTQPRPPYPPYSPAAQKPPKKKKSAALVVFLWILSVLSIGTIVGFSAYFVHNIYEDASHAVAQGDEESAGRNAPGDNRDNSDGSREDPDAGESPDFGAVVPPDPNAEKPDIEVPENPAGIQISEVPAGNELAASEIYDKVAVSTVTIAASITGSYGEGESSTGTGIIATADGYIITNAHVVFSTKSTSVKITTLDEKEYDAIVVGVDRSTDLAVLKANNHNFTPAEFGNADSLKIGEWVIAIGNPGGAQFYASLTRGVVSGLNRAVADYSENGMLYIQTDAAINPGNSGGPLVNMHGQVVGINSSKIVTSGYEGMGFAIPISRAQSIINELMENGYIKGRTRLGIKGQDYADDFEERYGFQISEIDGDSAFAGTAAQPGDVIIAVDGNEVYSLASLSNLLLNYTPGDKVTVTLYRPPATFPTQRGRELEVEITLLEDSGETQG